MSYTVSLQQRIQQLKAIKADLPDIMRQVAKDATLRAIEATADATPPKNGTGRVSGTNTISGELKQHWATDSISTPLESASTFITFLANNMQYASYVNNGHRMDKHFVPGLYINPDSGLLEYDPGNKKVGIVVGTKTAYVKGEYMVDKGKEMYEKVVLSELDKKIQERMK